MDVETVTECPRLRFRVGITQPSALQLLEKRESGHTWGLEFVALSFGCNTAEGLLGRRDELGLVTAPVSLAILSLASE
eukprot:SAG11_NODE_5622_length_1505_cov_1.290896_1_plen_78_part_00